MSADEFELIRRYFTRQDVSRNDVRVGIGDDAALLQVPPGQDLVVCMDTLVAGVHFPSDTAAAAIGHKALAVNLSDLAAMGAVPAWATLSLTLPRADPDWLAQFAQGFFALARRFNVQLVGGDTTRGPLSVTVQAHGLVAHDRGLRRRGAAVGDCIYVSGTLGDAGLALRLGKDAPGDLRRRLDFPEPRIGLGQALLDFATAAIDVSDGLLADLGHLLEAEGLGASLQLDELPRSAAFRSVLDLATAEGMSAFYDLPLAAGDDYELCFTVPEQGCADLEQRAARLDCAVTRIGRIESQAGIRCRLSGGAGYLPTLTGYNHFGDAPYG